MKIKLLNAVILHNVVSQLNVSCLSDNQEKLSLIRLAMTLKRYAQQWEDTRQTAQAMATDSANTLLTKEAVTEVEVSDDLLISIESAEKLVVANSENMPAGALGLVLYNLTKEK